MKTRKTLKEKAELLREFYRRERRAPGYQEAMDLLGYHSRHAVFRLWRRLVAEGFATLSPQGKFTFTGRLTGGVHVLGHIQAGFPSPAEEELADTLSLDDYLVRRPEATFMLTVTGDSMLDAGIHPGDLVLVEKGVNPRNNDVVVAQVDEEWTLKYYVKDQEGIRLEPANCKYRTIRPSRSLCIGGVVKAVIRRYA